MHNPPAFPVSSIDGFTVHGMDLRDYFAAQALSAIIVAANSAAAIEDICQGIRAGAPIANGAYALADAMLAARAKGTPDV